MNERQIGAAPPLANTGPTPLWKRVARLVLFAVGVGALTIVVRRVGPARVGAILLAAGPWVPVIIALEAGWMSVDIFVLRALLGDRARDAPRSAYARSAIAAYAVNILAPAGRTSGEVARAVLLAPYLGTAQVTAAALEVQGSGLLGNAFISVVCAAAVALQLGATSRLTLLIAGNGVITLASGVVFLAAARSPRAWRLVRRVVKRLPPVEASARDASWHPRRAIALSCFGRCVESLMYMALLGAASGVLSLGRAFMAQGVALVTSLFGDVIPQRAGLSEGAFMLFSSDLGLAGAAAVSIALLYRANQLLLAGACVIVTFFWKRQRRRPSPSS